MLSYRLLFLTLTILVVSVDASAQLEIGPAPRADEVDSPRGKTPARTQDATPLSLPFWEDFSALPPGYPDPQKWVNSTSVSISDGAGINPPTINVAEFNGLDANGTPYNVTETTLNGFTDTLTSVEILLDEVLSGEQNSVYLSFSYQWKGNGEPPDNNDFLQVEFKNVDGGWELIHTIYGVDMEDQTVFNTALLQVSGERFFHAGFQFRFRSYGRLSGRYDTWMLDYIYLNKGRSNSVPLSFPDRAIVSTISTMFGKYYAMPYAHFLLEKEVQPVKFGVRNLKNFEASTNFDSFATFVSYTDDVASAPHTIQLDAVEPIKGGTNSVLNPLELYTASTLVLPDVNDPLQFDPDADSVKIALKISVNSGDLVDNQAIPGLDFTVNDTITTHYLLTDEYRYDDGIAEYSVKLTNPGNRLAYRFEMPVDTATLYGFDIYFPHLTGLRSEQLDFLIYEDEDGMPAATPKLSLLSRTITKTINNKFITILINPPQFINDSIFYIGYRQSTSPNTRLGLDVSNDTSEDMFVYYDGAWHQDPDIQGSLMIRPRFGKGTGVISNIPEEIHPVSLFPNPNDGTFYLHDDVQELSILDITGKPTRWTSDDNEQGKRVTIISPVSGLYLVRWSNNRGIHTRKVAVKK